MKEKRRMLLEVKNDICKFVLYERKKGGNKDWIVARERIVSGSSSFTEVYSIYDRAIKRYMCGVKEIVKNGEPKFVPLHKLPEIFHGMSFIEMVTETVRENPEYTLEDIARYFEALYGREYNKPVIAAILKQKYGTGIEKIRRELNVSKRGRSKNTKKYAVRN